MLPDYFHQLPIPVRQIAVAIKGVQNTLVRYGDVHAQTLEILEGFEKAPAEHAEAYQSNQLAKLLYEARLYVPHYQERLAGYTVKELQDIASKLRLSDLPFLEKAELKKETTRFFNSSRKKAAIARSSGSTGTPLEVQYDTESVQRRWAIMKYHRTWGGIEMSARSVHFSGHEFILTERKKPPFWMLNPVEKQLLVSPNHLRADHLPAIWDRIVRWRPEVITGYPNSIVQLASYAAAQNLSLPSLKVAMTTAETLNPDIRETIEGGLGVNIFDFYSASEGAPFMLECEEGNYHECAASGIIEILGSDGEPAPLGAFGEIVGTSFVQWKTPLIRYKTGDWAKRPDHDRPCACGRTAPYVESVLGRVEDMVYTQDGRKIGLFSYLTLKYVVGISEAQIIQTSPSTFTLRVVLDGTEPLASVQEQADESFDRVLGYSATVHVEAVDQIPRGPSGKIRLVMRQFDV